MSAPDERAGIPPESPRTAELSSANREWIAAFRKANRRRPRVLHISNIANNAYNNAKLMNEAGLDCDVICNDYYHIMACPEWEDADFEGDHGDDNRPDWSRLDLHGFERPEWFAQGPLDFCIAYLSAKRGADEIRRRWLWRRLSWWSRTQRFPGPLAALTGALFRLREAGFYVKERLRVLGTPEILFERFDVKFRKLNDGELYPWGGLAYLLLMLPVVVVAIVLRLALLALFAIPKVRRDRARARRERALSMESVRRVTEAMTQAFPGRADRITARDLWPWVDTLPQWRSLLAHYDVVQAYATHPIIPLLAGKRYFAFEHGTLRDIPFSPDGTGRSTAIGYRLAEHVFVTNHDCLENAQVLAGDRVTSLNHPYDERHGERLSGAGAVRAELQAHLGSDILFFFPTRHDWVPGTGYADKANDVFLRAFATLRAQGVRAGMVCCEWGSNVAQSRALLEELGCARQVKWVRPLGTIQFERVAKASDCVVDQFKLGAFGGVMFKAMAVGRPVCTFLDDVKLRAQYGVAPPAINCRTEGEIVRAFTRLCGERSELEQIGAACAEWMRMHHNASRTINAQLDKYREFLSASRAAQTKEQACG